MASYLDNKHSPTVKSLEKFNFVVSPEDKTNTQFGNAVINDIRQLVDKTKNSRNVLWLIFMSGCLVRKSLKTSVWGLSNIIWDALKAVLGRYEHASCHFYYRRDGSCSGQSRNCMRVF
jgi:hypothetical protein